MFGLGVAQNKMTGDGGDDIMLGAGLTNSISGGDGGDLLVGAPAPTP